MNTMTLSDTTAVATAESAVASADERRLIPLSKLRPSSRNVRRSRGTAIPELAASIARLGLLQNLAVIASADGEHFDVVAGRRRLTALKLLVKRRKLAKDVEVSCLQVPDGAARTVSLTENVQREAMLGRVLELSCLSFVGHGRGSIYRGTLFDARQGQLALARVGRPVGVPDNSRSHRPSSLLSRKVLRAIHCLMTGVSARATEDTDGHSHPCGLGPPRHTGRPADPCVGTDGHHRAGVLLPESIARGPFGCRPDATKR